jgi:hypothetical protein
MRLVQQATTPQRLQTWKSAVFVPKAYAVTSEESLKWTLNAADAFAVHLAPCFLQNVQEQARAAIVSARVGH